MEFVLLFLLKIQFYQYVALKDDLLRKKNVQLVSWCIKHIFESDTLTCNIVYGATHFPKCVTLYHLDCLQREPDGIHVKCNL